MLLLNSPLPPLMLLDDVNDLLQLKIHLGQCVSPAKWGVPEAVAARDRRAMERTF